LALVVPVPQKTRKALKAQTPYFQGSHQPAVAGAAAVQLVTQRRVGLAAAREIKEATPVREPMAPLGRATQAEVTPRQAVGAVPVVAVVEHRPLALLVRWEAQRVPLVGLVRLQALPDHRLPTQRGATAALFRLHRPELTVMQTPDKVVVALTVAGRL
jgi:hypothetical protein